MKTRLLISAVLLVLCANTQALTLFHKIGSPGGCPENLQITAKPDSRNPDFVKLSVRFKPREP